MFAVPFTILIVVNTLVIIAVHRSRKVHAKLNVSDDGLRKQELAKEIATSVMLVAVVVAFLLCNTLVTNGWLAKALELKNFGANNLYNETVLCSIYDLIQQYRKELGSAFGIGKNFCICKRIP
uniref:G-protein coupled receptors family 1 profile domain-containing protein n=1 Tax=Parascaris equorum TaxID=6256 RepID=A0A914RFX4_PAREQ